MSEVTGGSTLRALCVAALAVAALAAPALARAGDGQIAVTHNGKTGVMQRHVGHTGRGPEPNAPKNALTYAGQLQNHGGPVMKTSTVYAMYWFPAGYTLDSSWKGLVDGYLANVAADSGTTTNVFSAMTQYGLKYQTTYGGSAVDDTPFPANGCDATTALTTVCLSETQIFEELKDFVAKQGWDTDGVSTPNQPTAHPTHLVLVYLPPNVANCFDAPYDQYCSASSSRQYYCAYHTAWVTHDATFVWANMPWSWNLNGCGGGNYPNRSANGNTQTADEAIDVTSHEWIEALTDPYLNAWYDANGYEIADKCQNDYGTALGTVGSDAFNQVVGGSDYYTQLEYSNRLKNCYQLGAPAVQSFVARAGLPGDTITLHGTNFHAPAVVRFNGIASPAVSVVSPTEIHAEVPAGNVKGKITVQSLGGLGASKETFNSAPVITSFTPGDGKQSSVVTLTGVSFTGLTNIKFGSKNACGWDFLSDTSADACVPAGFTSGKITVITSHGAGVSKTVFMVTKVTGVTAAAAAGHTITITGAGLASATTVDFPNHAGVAVARTTPTTVRVVVPSDAQLGALTVHTPNIDAGGLDTPKSFRPLPRITSFTPVQGAVGQAVTITGTNLLDASSLKFGATQQPTFTVASATQITTTAAAVGKVVVVTPGGTATSTQSFAATNVKGISPTSAAPGAVVTIAGTGLGSTTAVDFPGHPGVAPVSVTATTVKVAVPGDAGTGELTVETAELAIDTPSLTVLPTRISGFTPAKAPQGATVTLSGVGFGTASAARTVSVGSVDAASVTYVSPSALKFVVPAGAPVSGVVHVTVDGGPQADSPSALTVTATIASLSPTHAEQGEDVTLGGSGFTGATAVKFDGVAATSFHVDSDTQITATVPAGATSGTVTVTRGAAPATLTSAGDFVVDAAVSSFSPLAGPAGTEVTIDGSGFTGATAVTFDGVDAATFSVDSDAKIRATVPAGAGTGAIEVTTAAGSADSSAAFTFVPLAVTGISPAVGGSGTVVTITGTGFTTATAVAFNGVAAATFHVDSDTQITATAPSGVFTTGPVTVTSPDGTAASPVDFVNS